jgi:hypothetical protein
MNKYNVDEHRERRKNLITETNIIWILSWFKFITGGERNLFQIGLSETGNLFR